MAQTIVKTLENGNRRAVVYYEVGNDCYLVKLFINGKHYKKHDATFDDLDEATGRAYFMIVPPKRTPRKKNPLPALLSMAGHGASLHEMFKPAKRAPVRKRNPVPPSKAVQLRDASELYKNFTGHEVDDRETITIDKPVLPDVMLVVGDIDGVMYTTIRDGVKEKYIHRFKAASRPLFCVSHDGKQIYMLGGAYDFTERGIVDKT